MLNQFSEIQTKIKLEIGIKILSKDENGRRIENFSELWMS